MSKAKFLGGLAVAAALLLPVTTPALASDKTANTLLGAGLGAAAGAILSEGDTLTTLGGAAAGGLLGNLLTEEPRKKHRHYHSRTPKHHYAGSRHHGPRHVHHAGYGNHWKHPGKGHHKHHHKHRGKRHHHRR